MLSLLFAYAQNIWVLLLNVIMGIKDWSFLGQILCAKWHSQIPSLSLFPGYAEKKYFFTMYYLSILESALAVGWSFVVFSFINFKYYFVKESNCQSD
jgi:hypothetical protein